VIGIIALLISILLPTLGKAREQARSVMCMSNMRQLMLGFVMYADSYKGALPYDGEDGDSKKAAITCPDGLGWDSPCLWINAVPSKVNRKPYSQMQEDAIAGLSSLPQNGGDNVLICPSGGEPASALDKIQNGYYEMYGLPGTGTRDTYVSYAYNSKLLSDDLNLNPNNANKGRISMLRPASLVAVFVEKRMQSGEVSAADDSYYQSQGGQAGRLTGRTLGRIKSDWQRFAARHNHGGYIAFADGHVGFMTQRDVLTSSGMVSGNPNFNQPGKIIWSIYGPVIP
jgi:prepilin-type processing-associated H-X9-DG protein